MKLDDLRKMLAAPQAPELETSKPEVTELETRRPICKCCKHCMRDFVMTKYTSLCIICYGLCYNKITGEFRHTSEADTVQQARRCPHCNHDRMVVLAGIGGGVSIQPCGCTAF